MSEDNDYGVGYFNEVPEPSEPHPKNLLRMLGDQIRSYRLSLPGKESKATHFAKRLSAYTGSPVNRQRINKIESGDHNISFDAVAATLCELGLMKPILKVLYKGSTRDLRYLTLLSQEIGPAIREVIEKERAVLHNTKSDTGEDSK